MALPRVKICCISSVTEAQLAIEAGASALGLVGHMPSGPGVIEDALITQITRATPPPLATFLLTSETKVSKIIAHHRQVHTNTIQLVDALTEGTYADLRAALPGVKLVQVIHVTGTESLPEAMEIGAQVDALLLDSGNPNAAVKELGGTGRVYDWSVSRQICERAPVPVFLAGGLKPENVQEAVAAVQPYGLDLCSGVRTAGKLDARKLQAFFDALRGVGSLS